MAASISLVEARVKDAEKALKAQYKRMKDTLEAVANKVVDDIDPIPKDEPKESQEGPYGRARNVTIITSSLLRALPMLVKILQTLPMLNKHRRGQGSTPRKCPLTPGGYLHVKGILTVCSKNSLYGANPR